MIHRASITLILLFALGLIQITIQNICYTKCSQGQCTNNNALACTGCDKQFLLINQQCIPTRGQSESIKYFTARTQNIIDKVGFTQRNYSLVTCGLGAQQSNANITFFNLTVSTQGIYFSQPFLFVVPTAHQYIQLKMNAILFNRRSNPQIQLLIVNQQSQDLLRKKVRTNVINIGQQNSVSCFPDDGSVSSIQSSYPFFINQKISTSSSVFVQITTVQAGDQLGISNFQLFYGNCHPTCATCNGASATECLSCRNFFRFNQTTSSCQQCPSGFQKVGDACLPCPYNCRTCRFSEISGTSVCIQCANGLNYTAPPNCYIYDQVFVDFSQKTFLSSQGWQSDEVSGNIVTNCSSYSVAGGIPNGLGGSSIYKLFTGLNSHQSIWIKVTILLIDQQAGNVYTGQIRVDGKIQRNISIVITKTEQSTTQCGVQLLQFMDTTIVVDNIGHTRQSALISISGFNNYFGIRDFALGVINETSDKNCLQVMNGTCIQCNNGLILNPTGLCAGCSSRYYLKQGKCQACPIFCKQCQYIDNATQCLSCDEPLVYNNQSRECLDEANSIYTVAISPKTRNQTVGGWTFYPRLQSKGSDLCGQDFILGSSEILYRSILMQKKSYSSLPQHQGVIIHFMFYQIDDYDSADKNINTVQFKIDDQIRKYTVSNQGYQKCGNSSLDRVQKVVLTFPEHVADTLKFSVIGKTVKFGINQIIIFLTSCPECIKNIVSYDAEVIPVYRIQEENLTSLKVKIVFNDYITVLTNKTDDLFKFSIIQNAAQTLNLTVAVGQATGNLAQSDQLIQSYIKKSRQLIGQRPLFRNYNNSNYTVTPIAPDNIFSQTSSNSLMRPIKLSVTENQLPTYTYIRQDANRSAMRNLRNFFRGIAVLAMWIGLVSFFIGLSAAFDDLFILTQVIFVHIFIQSEWLSAAFKVPISGMQFVQFMAWLPNVAKDGIQAGIIPFDHYQRSPIVYEQYYKDITFARTIYHVVLYLVGMIALYLIIRLVRALTRPTIGQILDGTKKHSKRKFIRSFYFDIQAHSFVALDKVVRFCFFTVVWACILQFTWFQNLPQAFFQWNAAICIIFFIVFVLYPILGFVYLWKQYNITSRDTFNQMYGGIRIRRQRLWYFPLRYAKLLAIALLIGLLYKANPLAVLIPLMVIHIADAVIVLVLKPYHLQFNSNRVLSWFGKNYWVYYKWSHFIQNILFFILELILIIMYGRRNLDTQESYFSTGYAACAFVILLLINGLIRLAWTLIRYFEACFDQFQSQNVKVDSSDHDIPINQVRNMNAQTTRLLLQRNDGRRPSIQQSVVAHQFVPR